MSLCLAVWLYERKKNRAGLSLPTYDLVIHRVVLPKFCCERGRILFGLRSRDSPTPSPFNKTWVGIMLMTQPFFVGGIENVEKSKSSAFNAAFLFFITFLSSIGYMIHDSRRTVLFTQGRATRSRGILESSNGGEYGQVSLGDHSDGDENERYPHAAALERQQSMRRRGIGSSSFSDNPSRTTSTTTLETPPATEMVATGDLLGGDFTSNPAEYSNKKTDETMAGFFT